MKTNAVNEKRIPFSSIAGFLLITFILSWGVFALFFLVPDFVTRIFGEISGNNPLFFLAVWAPAIAAFIIVSVKFGFAGLRRYLSKFLRWRVSLMWYLFLFIGVPLVFYGGAAINGKLFTEPFPAKTFSALLPAMGIMLIQGPIEEFGWRGFALPLLQRKLAPVWSALIIGVIWGFWHLPAFLASGTQQSSWAFLPFFLGTIAISIIISALYNASKGSILLAALMHYQLINPIFPDAQPYDTYILAFIAILIVVVQYKKMFYRSGGVTEIVPVNK
jgi:hypothetical protein